MDLLDHKADEDICFKCQQGGGENWVQCDSCDKWYHISCIGLTQLPGEDEDFKCSDCQKKEANANMLTRSISEMPN